MASPLHIEPGLDGAEVELALVREPPPSAGALYLYLGLGFVLVFTQLWWLALFLVLGATSLLLLSLRKRLERAVLRLQVTPTQVLYEGRPVQVRADFQYVWVDERRFVIDGGLTRKEQARFSALITRRDLGQVSEVDPRLHSVRARE